MCFLFLPREKVGESAGKSSHEYNNRLQSYRYTCEEYREYIKGKKAKINPASLIYMHFPLCNTYLAKSCGVFVLSPKLCFSPAARLPLQSCLNFHHLGTQAQKCPKIKRVLPLAEALGSWEKSSFTFKFCLVEQSQISLPAEHQPYSPHLCLPHTPARTENVLGTNMKR